MASMLTTVRYNVSDLHMSAEKSIGDAPSAAALHRRAPTSAVIMVIMVCRWHEGGFHNVPKKVQSAKQTL